MKRTTRLIAIPAIASLMLAACSSGTDDPTTAPDQDHTQEQQADAPTETEDADDSPESQAAGPEIEGEGDTDVDGVMSTTVPHGDETYELDIAAVDNMQLPTSGTYVLEGMTGVVAIAEIGVEGPENMERMRELVGADPVTYIRIDVDNRNGTEEIGMYSWEMYDEDGNEYAFQNLNNQAVDWDEVIDDDSDLDREINDLAWEIEGEPAAVGQRNEQWLVGPGDLPGEVSVMSAQSTTFTDTFVPVPAKK